MIDRNAEPKEHRPPLRRIDPMHPGRKRVITAIELKVSGDRDPDPAVYRFSPMQDAWILREDA